MPKPNLSSMSVDALLKLRDDISRALDRKANEFTKSAFDAWPCSHRFDERQEGPTEVSQSIR
jgi:hypothetical protein